VNDLVLVGELTPRTHGAAFAKPGSVFTTEALRNRPNPLITGVKSTTVTQTFDRRGSKLLLADTTSTYEFKPPRSWSYNWVGQSHPTGQNFHCFRVYAFIQTEAAFTCLATADSSSFTVQSSKKTRRHRNQGKSAISTHGPQKRLKRDYPLLEMVTGTGVVGIGLSGRPTEKSDTSAACLLLALADDNVLNQQTYVTTCRLVDPYFNAAAAGGQQE
jgi:hypothetical protein